MAFFIQEYPEFGTELLSYCNDFDFARKLAEDSYIDCYESLEDYVQQITEETTEIPEHLVFLFLPI